MGFGKGKRWKNNHRDNTYRKKMGIKTKIRLAGVAVVIVGFMIALYDDSKKPELAVHQQLFLISIGMIIIGMAMVLQRKLLEGLKNASKPRCNCCKCTNCGRGHNHWTHDDDDARRRHY